MNCVRMIFRSNLDRCVCINYEYLDKCDFINFKYLAKCDFIFLDKYS